MYLILYLRIYLRKSSRINHFRKIVNVLVTEVLSWRIYDVLLSDVTGDSAFSQNGILVLSRRKGHDNFMEI